jgi:Uma2 family endonuclease
MSSTAEDLIRRHRFTVEDYYRMADDGILTADARVELVDGEVIEMPPIGAPHASVVTDIQNLLIAAVGDRAIVRVQNPVRLDRHSEPQPDIALVTPPGSKYRTRHPTPADILLLVEVADTSLRLDRDIKLGIYARSGIPEVWLLDLNTRDIMRYWAPAVAGYLKSEPLVESAAVPLPGLPAVHLDLSRLL